MDTGTKYTEKKIKKLENQLDLIYYEAYKDVSKKLKDFTDKYVAKDAIYQQKVAKGEMSQEDYEKWVKGQVFQGKQWKAKKEQVSEIMTQTNKIAAKIVNGDTQGVFAANANYTSYDLEHNAGINFGFGVYDNYTVAKLAKDDPKLLPEWKINEPKDYIWNQKKLNNALTQGIIQGEGIEKIANRIATNLSMQNKNSSLTFARTAMTGAQNAGRDQSLMDAKAKGITVVKQWMATLDDHTRDTHAEIDGETIKVGDKWHPMMFSNGCRYPGDPNGPAHEVYNCRCTLVGDIESYPETFQRYDNIDGHPVDQMTYKEWYKAKYGKDFQPSKMPQKPQKVKKSAVIDYDKYGGKEVYDLLSQYESFDDLINHTTPDNYDEFQKITDALGGDNDSIDKAIKEIHGMSTKKTAKKEDVASEETEEEKQKKAYEKAKADLDKIDQEIKDKGADKVFEGIWKDQNITYADYEAKKNTIEAKKQYYEYQIKDLKQQTQTPLKVVAIENMEKKLAELEEFEKYGEEYSKLLANKAEAQKLVNDLKPKFVYGDTFGKDAYTQERKDGAVWAKSRKEADDAFRPATEESWQNASQAEKDAAYDYTAGSGKFNRPTRGYDGSWSNPKGIGNVPLNNERAEKEIEDLTNLLERSYLQKDTWLQRGVETLSGLSNFVGIPESTLRNATQEELEQLLLGKTISDAGFMSCGSSKGTGFSGSILNIYCPAGTQGLYVEPFSAFGNGSGHHWDGKKKQDSFGGELETLLQRNSDFVITKVEKGKYGQIYLDIDLVGQDPHRYDAEYAKAKKR